MTHFLYFSLFFVCVNTSFLIACIRYTQGKTHTMLGPNPRKVATTPTSSTGEFPPKTAITIQTQSTEGGLMVKAMDEIFRHVEQSDNPDAFKVINYIKRHFFCHFEYIIICVVHHYVFFYLSYYLVEDEKNISI